MFNIEWKVERENDDKQSYLLLL